MDPAVGLLARPWSEKAEERRFAEYLGQDEQVSIDYVFVNGETVVDGGG